MLMPPDAPAAESSAVTTVFRAPAGAPTVARSHIQRDGLLGTFIDEAANGGAPLRLHPAMMEA